MNPSTSEATGEQAAAEGTYAGGSVDDKLFNFSLPKLVADLSSDSSSTSLSSAYGTSSRGKQTRKRKKTDMEGELLKELQRYKNLFDDVGTMKNSKLEQEQFLKEVKKIRIELHMKYLPIIGKNL